MASSLGEIVGFGARLSGALLTRPHLWAIGCRQGVTLAPRRWWATAPHLPVPTADYLHLRQVTATGDGDELPAVDDVITWLEWCRSMRGLPRER